MATMYTGRRRITGAQRQDEAKKEEKKNEMGGTRYNQQEIL
jgi:hypothetical protein